VKPRIRSWHGCRGIHLLWSLALEQQAVVQQQQECQLELVMILHVVPLSALELELLNEELRNVALPNEGPLNEVLLNGVPPLVLELEPLSVELQNEEPQNEEPQNEEPLMALELGLQNEEPLVEGLLLELELELLNEVLLSEEPRSEELRMALVVETRRLELQEHEELQLDEEPLGLAEELLAQQQHPLHKHLEVVVVRRLGCQLEQEAAVEQPR